MTTGASALDVAATALYTALNVASLTAILTGGVHDVPPQGVAYPYGWFTLSEDPREVETFAKLAMEVEVRLQVYDVDSEARESTQQIDQAIGKAAELLHHQLLSTGLTGWTTHHLAYFGAQPMGPMRDEQNRIVRSKLARFHWIVSKN